MKPLPVLLSLIQTLHHQHQHTSCSVQFSLSVLSNSLRLNGRKEACQASLSITISRSLPKFMSIELVMPSNHLILCRPLLLLPSVFPSIRVFSNESALHIRWPKLFSFNISPSNEYSGLISFRMDSCMYYQLILLHIFFIFILLKYSWFKILCNISGVQ